MPIVRIEMLKGRSPEQKRELASAITRETVRIAVCAERDVDVIITEIDAADWISGGAPSHIKSVPGDA